MSNIIQIFVGDDARLHRDVQHRLFEEGYRWIIGGQSIQYYPARYYNINVDTKRISFSRNALPSDSVRNVIGTIDLVNT